jgi:hypothetical protein
VRWNFVHGKTGRTANMPSWFGSRLTSAHDGVAWVTGAEVIIYNAGIDDMDNGGNIGLPVSDAVIAPDRRRVAGITFYQEGGQYSGRLFVGPMADRTRPVFQLGSTKVQRVQGWLDDRRVLVQLRSGELRVVDTRTKQAVDGVPRLGGTPPTQVQFATDLLPNGFAPAVPPSSPLDPRLLTGAGFLMVLLTLAILVGRRRARA